MDQVRDARELAATAISQGLAVVVAWDPGCNEIEDTFDDVIVGDGSNEETVDNVILATSHPNEPIEGALEFFLDVLFPATGPAERCTTWVVFALGNLAAHVEHVLEERGARRLEP